MSRLQLHGTPLSHFTRKIRVLLAELGIDFDFVRPPGVLVAGTQAYGDNPLMRVPTLVDGDDHIFESDHIARHIVRRFDPTDQFGVRSDAVEDLNRLAALTGIMANEVTLILAKRAGGVDMTAPYFGKLMTAIESGLAWLDARAPTGDRFDYRDITLVCAWQHLEHYKLLSVDRYGTLAARVARFATRPSVVATAPEASLAEAKAAGWSPG